MRRKRILAGFVIAAVGAALLHVLAPSQSPPAAANPSRSEAPSTQPQPLAIPAREPIAASKGELFAPYPAGVPASPALSRSAPRKQPSAPPMPYRVAGQVMDEGGMRVVLAKANRVYEVRKGDTLDDGYRVESIEPDAVTLVYLPLALRERLLVSGPALLLEEAPAALLGELVEHSAPVVRGRVLAE